jgi:hypothetical protein
MSWDELPLGRWAAGQSKPRIGEVVDLAEFRRQSARWILEIKPRAESAEATLRTLDRVLGLEAPAPVVDLAHARCRA